MSFRYEGLATQVRIGDAAIDINAHEHGIHNDHNGLGFGFDLEDPGRI